MLDCNFCAKKLISSEAYINHLIGMHSYDNNIDQTKVTSEIQRIQHSFMSNNTKKKINISFKKKKPVVNPKHAAFKAYLDKVDIDLLNDDEFMRKLQFTDEEYELLETSLIEWNELNEQEKKIKNSMMNSMK